MAVEDPATGELWHVDKVYVYLHSDAIPNSAGDVCDCGVREWVVQTPRGWMWTTLEGPGTFLTLDEAMNYANRLSPYDWEEVKRSDPPDCWILSVNRVTDLATMLAWP